MGCWLAVYLTARPDNPEGVAPRQLSQALVAMLTARGIPASEIEVVGGGTLGAVARQGSDPVEVADALGYVLYCDANLKVRITPKIPISESVGSFDLDELASYTPGDDSTLPANRIVASGELVRVIKVTDRNGSTYKERVPTGWRTTTKRTTVRGRRVIETETILEPPSEISRFSAAYEKTTDPNALIVAFSEPLQESAIKSQETTIVTTRDSKGYIIKRERKIVGCAAKGLSSFYSAWAGASLPKPAQSTIEPPVETPITQGPREYTIFGAGGDSNTVANTGASSAFSGGGEVTAVPMTLLRPSGMFEVVTLLEETEEWDYKSDEVKYTREQYIPLGAIMPEVGNPIFGYQDPSEQSTPIYHDPLPLTLAEKETIIWEKDSVGRWEMKRNLSQAKGVSNAQEPRDAMSAIQFTSDQASTTDRSWVALSVASQLKTSQTTIEYSDPPGASPVEEMMEAETYTPYLETVEISGEDLLNRTIEVQPSAFCPNIESIRQLVKYEAIALRGMANTIKIGLPLSILPYDIPPNSIIELEGKQYLTVRVSASVNSAESILYLDLWAL